MSIVDQDHVEATGESASDGGTHAHLGEQASDRDAPDSGGCEHAFEVRALEPVVTGFSQNPFASLGSRCRVDRPVEGVRLVNQTGRSVVLEMNDEGTRGASSSG